MLHNVSPYSIREQQSLSFQTASRTLCLEQRVSSLVEGVRNLELVCFFYLDSFRVCL